jgi:hypothetical protein
VNKLEIEGTYLNIVMVIYSKPINQHHGKNWKHFILSHEQNKGVHSFCSSSM